MWAPYYDEVLTKHSSEWPGHRVGADRRSFLPLPLL